MHLDLERHDYAIRVKEVELATGHISSFRVLAKLPKGGSYSTSHMNAQDKADVKIVREPADFYEWHSLVGA